MDIRDETVDDSMRSSEPEQEKGKDRPKLSCSIICNFLLHESVMEHFLMMTMFAYMVRSVTGATLFTDKACKIELKFEEDICKHLHNNTDEENQVQKMANNYHVAQTIVSMAPAIVATILFGSWSDVYGRKIPILIATFGLLLDLICVTLNYVQFEAHIYWLVVCAIPAGVSGGLMVILMSGISYIVDNTTTDTRAIRFAFLEMTFILAMPVGMAVGGIIFEKHGYLAVFVTSISITAFAFLYLLVRLKEPTKKKITNKREAILHLFSLENVKTNIRTATRKREGTIRREIWLLFGAMFCHILSAMGTMSMSYFYTMKMYGWNNYKYSMVTMAFSIISGVLVMITIPIMIKLFKFKDMSMAFLGEVSQLASTILKGLAFKESLYYIACLCGVMSAITSIGSRNRLSKLVAKDEAGKVFSVLSLTETLVPLIGTTMFGAMYSASVSYYPGLTYIVSGSLLGVPILIYMYVYKFGNKTPNYEKMEDEMDIPDVTKEIELSKD